MLKAPARKIIRQDPSSRARLQYMSPLSQQVCKMYAEYQRTNNIRKLKKYEASELVLDDEQNAEMCSVMEVAQPDELEKKRVMSWCWQLNGQHMVHK